MCVRRQTKAALLALLADTTFATGIGACLDTALRQVFVGLVV